MGQGALHTDGVIKTPSLIVDRAVIEEDGRFVAEQLASLQAGLIRGAVSPPRSYAETDR